MMRAPVPLFWVSESALRAVGLAVHEAARAWAQGWGVEEPDEPKVQALAASSAMTGWALDLAEEGAPEPAGWTAALAEALFGGDSAGSAMAAAVVGDAGRALRGALRRTLGLDDKATETSEAAPDTAPGHRGVLVQLTLLGRAWRARAPLATLARSGLLQRPKTAPVPRWSAEQALAATPVSLLAVLGQVQVDVLDVLNLAHGDVLLLPQPGLDTTVQVQGVGTTLRLAARLGSTGALRGVQWQAA